MTTTDEPVWETVKTVIPRDRWDRPLIIPPGGDGQTTVPYTRVTTFVGSMEDSYNLDLYHQRMVAQGLSLREDLLLRVASLGPLPEDEGPDVQKQWKQTMNALCKDAQEAASASAKANIGTGLHAFTERHNRGREVGVVPRAFQTHIDSYIQATKDLEFLHVERFAVHDELQLGGTPDAVVRVKGRPKLIIADTKTGRIDFGVAKMAMQLGVYSRCQFYDIATGRRTSMGDIDQDWGIIVALNARTGQCELHWIDIGKACQYLDLARQVREFRKVKDWLYPYDQAPALPDQDLVEQARAKLSELIDSAISADELVTLWRRAGTAWTDDHTLRATARKAALEAENDHLASVSHIDEARQ